MPDFLETKRQEITARIAEIEPVIAEHARLQAALKALGSVTNSAPSASSVDGRRGPGRPRGSRTAPTRTRATRASRPRAAAGAQRPGRRKGTGQRTTQAVALISENPGIAIPELAARMGIKANYLYRVLPRAAEEGKIKKVGGGWHPAAEAAPST